MTEENRQHLEFIQNIVNRMNTNSFQIKELTVLVITACLAIYASEKTPLILLVPILPTITFWFLDSYYLLQERKFRAIYNDLTCPKSDATYNIKLYEMPIQKYNSSKSPKFNFWNVFKSITIVTFYLSLIILIVLIYISQTFIF